MFFLKLEAQNPHLYYSYFDRYGLFMKTNIKYLRYKLSDFRKIVRKTKQYLWDYVEFMIFREFLAIFFAATKSTTYF